MRYLFIFILFILTCKLGAQERYYNYVDYDGDTTKLLVIESPTICDCVHKDWRNKDQKAICDRIYDYDFMSDEEKKAYDKKAKICRYPSVCDCARADMKDKGLVKKCDDLYFSEYMSESRLQEIKEEMAACDEIVDTTKDELDICDCININNDYKLKRKCDEEFFNEDFSEEKREEIEASIQKCVEESSYELKVSICDCAQFSTDPEFIKICMEQYDTTQMDSVELAAFKLDIIRCNEDLLLNSFIDSLQLSEDSVAYSVCDCVHLPAKPEFLDLKIACIKQWDFSKMTQDQIAAFKTRASRCKSIDEIKRNINFCDCVLRSSELSEREQDACDQLYKELDPEDIEFLLEECFYLEDENLYMDH